MTSTVKQYKSKNISALACAWFHDVC